MKPLIPIDYSEEEVAAVANLLPGGSATAATGGGGGLQRSEGAAAAAAAPPAAGAPEGVLTKEQIQAIINSIPSEREALYALPVDWEALESSGSVEQKLRPFTAKKMVEYLGEDEPSLVDHIVGKLKSRTGAASIEEGLTQILDDDAQGFVVKLWRMLCYEMYAARALRG